jgi:predicted dehydrogenase
MTPVRIGVAGLGYWGPNLARTFAALPDAELTWLCDLDEDIRRQSAAKYPGVSVTGDVDAMLADDALDAVVVATPPDTHADLVRRALAAGKHVFVEKPLALRAADAQGLASLARANGLALMVGHVLLFHPAVMKMKELIETEQLGDVLYLYGNRQNLGRMRRDETVLWSLAPHDVSVLGYLLDRQPVEVSARGASYIRSGVADVVFCFLRYRDGITAHLHLSWLDPQKLRRMTIVGSKRMAVFDDMEAERKLTVYEKSAVPPRTDAFGEYVQVRFGDIFCPRIAPAEPLRLECEHFLAAVRSRGTISCGSAEAVGVVRVLEALQRSLDADGEPVELGAGRSERQLRAVPSAL